MPEISPPPLGVYVHWPYCAKICPYCDFNVYRVRRAEEPAALARAIVADLAAQAELTGPRTLTSIFFGGGTPSLMEPGWAAEIVAAATQLWSPAADLEVSLEANPTDAEAERFAAFAAAGVTRLSLGLQALDDASLSFLGRNHDAATGVRAAKAAARAFPRLSLDLIYARPGQTAQAWAAELRQAVELGAEHLSPYQLTIESGTAFDRAVRHGRFAPADPELGAELYETTQACLEAQGFTAYEVSNHARGEAARSRHNLVYWRGWDYVGVGPGAHGRLTRDGVRHATVGEARPADYLARVAASGVGFATLEALSPLEAAEERVLSGLRIEDGVPRAELAVLELAPERIAQMVELGLLADDPARLRATAAGRLLLDRLTAELLT
ncbi:radical SAM family heme chaperone HemW [Phenylobacterium sp. LjRoot219]|uniref:radical SAM family heme chaperone HemW n=1 Tax=Phenylobacterium sp. LjRoot219 TaxID=3342283 RepID=UPI003ED0433A